MNTFTFFSFAPFGRKLYASFVSAFGLMMLLMSGLSFGQTNPTPFDLSTGNWTLTGWNSAVPAGSYPGNGATGSNATTGVVATAGNGNMMFWKHGGAIDPPITTAESANITAVYTAGSAKVVGNGTSGFYFDNTGGAGIGSAVLAINTTNRTAVQVAWTGRTIVIGARQYGIRLQYRVGISGAWTDANGTASNILYTGATAGSSQVMPTVTLPAGAENQPVVQLLWRFYYIGPSTGARPQFGLDEITVSSSAASTAPFLAITGTAAHGNVCPSSNATPINYTITNSGSTAADGVTVASTDSQFVVSGLSSTSIPSNGGTATYSVTFTPGSSGAKSATVTVASTTSGSNSPTNSLTGTGSTPVTQAVASSAATSVTAKSATLNGNVTTLGVCPATTEKGFVYSLTATNGDPLVSGTGVTKTPVAGIATGAYSLALSALSASTGYSYKAYVYDGATYTYGAVQTFSTATALTVTGTPAQGSTCPNVATAPKAYTITNNSNQTVTSLSVSSDNTEFVVSGLSSTSIAAAATATYTVTFTPTSSGAKTSVITISGTNAANITSNLTGTGSTPVTQAVTSSAATSVTAKSATLNGNVTTLGVCPATTEKGFVYSLTATNGDPLVSGTGVTKTTVAGIAPDAYSLALSALSSSSGYSYKAYVYDGTTYTYGAVQTFTTLIPPINDDCGGAIAIVLDATPVTGNVNNATQSLAATCAGTADDDVWYSFTTGAAGTYTIIAVGSASFDAVVDLRSGACNGINLSCADDTAAGGTETVVASGLAANTTYFVRVYDYESGAPATTTFTIKVISPPSTLSTNGTTAFSFGNQTPLTPSTSQSFNLSGANLTGAPGNITVTAPNTDFQVSNNNSTWGATTTVAYPTATLASTPVYVRFTPQSSGAKTGNITFSGGGTSGNPTIALTGTGVLPAPVATAATNIAATSFDANWGAVVGATGYELDVSKTVDFEKIKISEDFLKFTTNNGTSDRSSSLNTYLLLPGWTGAAVFEMTGYTKLGTGTAKGILTTPILDLSNSGGLAKLSVDLSLFGSDTGLVQVFHAPDGITFTQVGSDITLSTSMFNYIINIIGGTVNSKIRIQSKNASNNRYYLDNFKVIQDDRISGYAPKVISGGATITSSVTGLTADTTYYYRVRSTDGTPSANSNVITVNPASRGGSVSSDQAICSGTQPATLTLSGNNGTIVKWQKASDTAFTSPVDIANTTTTLTGADIGNLTVATYFRAVVQSFANPTANSAYATITVNPLPTATISGTATVCQNTVSPTITFTGANGTAPYTFTYTVNGGSNQTVTTTSGNSVTVAVSTTTAGSYDYELIKVAGQYCSQTQTGSAIVTVTPLVSAGTVSGAPSVFNGNTTPYTTTGATGGTWSSDNNTVASVDATGVVTGNALGTAVITYTVNSGCGSPVSSSATITVTDVTTWTGTSGAGSWNHEVPNSTIKASISGSYDTSVDGNFSAFSLVVDATGSLVITKDHVVTLEHQLTNNGSVTIESDGNLIQVSDSPANSGAITVKRTITIKNNNQYNYLISPTVGTNLKTDIYGTGNSAPFTLYHIESNNTFGNSGGAYIKGRGLAVKEPAGSGTVNAVFIGIPMNEAFSFPLANSNVGAGTTLGYNLTGNPYPSNIDLVKLYNLNTNKAKISGTFYFWDNTANTVNSQGGSGYDGAAYAIFNAAAGTYGTGNGAGFLLGGAQSAKVPTYVGKVGQGFMVKSKEQVIKTLDFDNTIRNADSGVGFFGNATKGTSSFVDDRFWLNLSAPTNITNQVAIVYFDAGLNTFAEDDSELKGLPSDVLYTVIGDKKAVINGRTPFVNNDIIPLGSNGFVAGNYIFSLGNTEGIFATTQNIYLKDKQTDIVTNLSQGNYTFTANAGESSGRFEIVYLPETVLATDGNVKENLIVYRDGNDFVVKAQSKKISSLEVFDTAGRLILALDPNSIKAVIPSEKIVNGVYVLKINQNGEITSKKIIR